MANADAAMGGAADDVVRCPVTTRQQAVVVLFKVTPRASLASQEGLEQVRQLHTSGPPRNTGQVSQPSGTSQKNKKDAANAIRNVESAIVPIHWPYSRGDDGVRQAWVPGPRVRQTLGLPSLQRGALVVSQLVHSFPSVARRTRRGREVGSLSSAQRVCESTVYGRADGSLGGFCCRHDTLLKDVVKAQYIWYRV